MQCKHEWDPVTSNSPPFEHLYTVFNIEQSKYNYVLVKSLNE